MSWNQSKKQKKKRNRRSPSPSPFDEPEVQQAGVPLPESWRTTMDNKLPNVCIEAHEADIIPSRNDIHLTLENPGSDSPRPGGKGSALLRWSNGEEDDPGQTVWVDRYDVRLLLSSLPRQDALAGNPSSKSVVDPESKSSPPPSPSGWSDLPSDTEDAFFFSTSETSELRRTKRRRLLDEAQLARLNSLRKQEGKGVREEDVPEEVWGDDNEEPEDEAQSELMRRTALHIAASPDPVLLEMRILANHGSDKRFAFLRGRWRHRWLRMKAAAKDETQKTKATAATLLKPPTGLNLGDYGDSDEEDSTGELNAEAEANINAQPEARGDPEEDAKAARRARAREWSARRKAEKAV